MSANVTSQGVTKLKELLFDSEAERLADLSRRLDALGSAHEDLRKALAERKAYEEGARAELARRLDTVYDRAGTPDRFSLAVSDVLEDAIGRTERERHDQLRTALAPVVVKTVKTEIYNSQDALVEALYPMTGQMVKAYVASAMKDLVNQVNRRLETNAFMLRLKSLTTGRSMAELALAESQRLQVEELLLIRRSTGELMARWPQTSASGNHDHVLGGVLSAINSFATEALEENENNLRQIDLGASQVYLRSSPAYLLAAKCSGTAGRSIEQVIDDEFLATVADIHGGGETSAQASESIGKLGPRMAERIAGQYEIMDRPALGVSPVKLLAVLIGLPLIAWIVWSSYISYQTNRVRETAREIIETSPEIKGYPTTLAVAPRGRSLTISGLAPNDSAMRTVLDRLSGALPGTRIDSQMAVVPQGAEDRSPEIAELRHQLERVKARIPQQAALTALLRTREDLDEALPMLARLTELAGHRDDANGKKLAATAQSLHTTAGETLAATLQARQGLEKAPPAAAEVDGIAALSRHGAELNRLTNDLARQSGMTSLASGHKKTVGQHGSPDPHYVTASQQIAATATDLRSVVLAVLQGEITRASIPRPEIPPPPVIPGPSPRDKLAAYLATHAIFFSDAIDYRNSKTAEATIADLARLIMDTTALVRVVGYTDERGTSSRNTSLSQLRADKVRDALIAQGVPATRLVAIGRTSINDISPTTGPQSPNRRVEFEIGFEGENAP